MNFGIKAILFDLDGTLIDSSSVIKRAWNAFGEKYSIDAQTILQGIQGKPSGESIAFLRPEASRHDIEEDAKWLEEMESVDTDGVIALPGAVELLVRLNRENVPWAIVTSGTVPVASARIRAAGLPCPKTLITPELVIRGKPEPEPYLLGAEKLGVPIRDCVVFEDAPAGIQAGVAAGASVIGVLTQFDSATLLGEKACACIASLADVSLRTDGEIHRLTVPEE